MRLTPLHWSQWVMFLAFAILLGSRGDLWGVCLLYTFLTVYHGLEDNS